MSLEKLFKDKDGKLAGNLKKKDSDDVSVESLSGKGKVLGLYFSAHWCPPCRAFTPQLAEWYKKFKKTSNGDNFDIVFVSSDRDQKTFDEYFDEMPWLALPYENRDIKSSLSSKFKVSGIPTLVLVEGEKGSPVTTDGRALVMDDPEGKDFPWAPKTFAEIITGQLVNKEKNQQKWEDIEADVIGLYFSAHWCGPCRAFTPQLVKTYNKLKEDGKKFEMVFVSSDRDQQSFDDYLKEMPWWAIPYGDDRKKALSRKFEISGIPSLVILEKSGKVITTTGRGEISQDPEGKDFPWYPKPVNALKGATAGVINDYPSIIWFTKNSKDAEAAKSTLTPVACDWIKKYAEGECEEVRFFYHDEENDEDDIGASLRSFANVGDVVLVLLNIPQQTIYCHNGEVTAATINQIVSDFNSSKLEMKTLRS